MRVPDKFKEYIWLVNTIRKSRRITFGEIQRKWLETDMSGGVELARSTFHRHKDAIEDIFGIFIDCDRSAGFKYFIGNDEVLREDSVQNWMLSTLLVSNQLSESLSLQSRILLEPIACHDYLKTVTTAMKRKVRIAVTYRRYGTDRVSHCDFEPYCIKLFSRRWYVIGHFHRDASAGNPLRDYFGIFSFDRMLSVQLTDVKFEMDADFDAKAYFGDWWGVMLDEEQPVERIVVRAYGMERFYLADLPLHHSQRSVERGEDYEDFELRLRPTDDFCRHLLSHGGSLQVLSPPSLVEYVRKMLHDALKRYE